MITIRFTTWVNAPVERCFLLATNSDLSSRMSNEVLTHGVGSNSLKLGDPISWRMGWNRQLYTSRIDAIRPYSYFRETMVAGIFKQYEHDHHFARMDDGTRIRNEIRFSTRLGPMRKLFESTVVRAGLAKMLAARNAELKRVAESNEWQKYVGAGDMARGTVTVNEAHKRISNLQRFA
jgi:ligand-binding SRPBCC domain-containing protein